MRRLVSVLLALVLLTACGAPGASPTSSGTGGPIKLTLAAYSTPREAYGKIIPLFIADWKTKTGQDVTIDESYQGSGAQSRAVVGGLEADVVALALQPDVSRIEQAGLITHNWQGKANEGMVTNSVVAFAVRKGNPKNIHDWADLAQSGLEVLTPNAATSGGAMWNILALYGAALRGHVTGVAAGDQPAAQAFLQAVLKNVTVMDKDARSSVTNFEAGVGDVAITYENEVLLGQQRGQDYELIVPQSSIVIETPVVVVDSFADKHGVRAAAEGFVAFLFTPVAQQIFADYGFRPVESSIAAATAGQFAAVPDTFKIDQFGGWDKAVADIFGDNGVYTLAIAAAQSQ